MSDIDYKDWTMEKSRLWSGTEDTEVALAEYAAVAEWCNETGQYTIIEDGEYYKVVELANDDFGEVEQESEA